MVTKAKAKSTLTFDILARKDGLKVLKATVLTQSALDNTIATLLDDDHPLGTDAIVIRKVYLET